MLIKKETNVGQIRIHEDVMSEMIKDLFIRYDGRIWSSNPKGKILEQGDEDSWKIIDHDGSPAFRLNVVVRFGISINSAVNQFIDDLIDEYYAAFGEKPHSVAVRVNGVRSKKVARRNILISRDNIE